MPALVGRIAVQALAAGKSGVMVALLPLGGENGHRLVPLGEAAGIERRIPAEWLRDGAIGVVREAQFVGAGIKVESGAAGEAWG